MRKLSLTVITGVLGLAFSPFACSPNLVATRTPVAGARVESIAPTSATPDTATDEVEEECEVAQTGQRLFLPITTEPPSGRILPATKNDCGFYNQSWQHFLHVTQPSNKRPAFVGYESFESVFGLKSAQTTSTLPLLNAGIRQAGDPHAVLVDQNHNPLYFSVYLNKVMADFVKQHQLNQLEALLKEPAQGGVPQDLEFPAGSVELKAAWKIVEPGENAANYFTMKARVPVLRNAGDTVVETSATREVTVALLSLHVVFVVQDHPEFIWATFEHVNQNGECDLAPAAADNPRPGATQTFEQLAQTYPLFNPATPIHQANVLPPRQLLKEGTQKFQDVTSVYRVFPASLTDSTEEDFGVTTLNKNIKALFDKTDPGKSDLRRHYSLSGAVWIDVPGADKADGIFKADRSFENVGKNKILAGEDGLSNMAMESFTQTTQPNCLSCHNTTSKSINGEQFLPARRSNVSNLLTLYARKKLEETR